jgi:hypothetical protein
MKNSIVEQVLILIGLIILAALLFTLPLQFLWNWLMPDIFGLRYITFKEAFGLNMLAGILFRTNVNIKKN